MATQHAAQPEAHAFVCTHSTCSFRTHNVYEAVEHFQLVGHAYRKQLERETRSAQQSESCPAAADCSQHPQSLCVCLALEVLSRDSVTLPATPPPESLEDKVELLIRLLENVASVAGEAAEMLEDDRRTRGTGFIDDALELAAHAVAFTGRLRNLQAELVILGAAPKEAHHA